MRLYSKTPTFYGRLPQCQLPVRVCVCVGGVRPRLTRSPSWSSVSGMLPFPPGPSQLSRYPVTLPFTSPTGGDQRTATEVGPVGVAVRFTTAESLPGAAAGGERGAEQWHRLLKWGGACMCASVCVRAVHVCMCVCSLHQQVL